MSKPLVVNEESKYNLLNDRIATLELAFKNLNDQTNGKQQ